MIFDKELVLEGKMFILCFFNESDIFDILYNTVQVLYYIILQGEIIYDRVQQQYYSLVGPNTIVFPLQFLQITFPLKWRMEGWSQIIKTIFAEHFMRVV